MAARAAVTPGDRGVASKHLLDGHMVVGSALRAHVRDARVLDLRGDNWFSGSPVGMSVTTISRRMKVRSA